MEESKDLIPFEGKPIRKVWHNEEWYFSVVDVVEALTDTPSPRQYWNIVKKRDGQLSTICLQLKLTASDGRKKEIGSPVVSSTNFLPPPKDKNKELPLSDDTPALF